MSRRGEVNGWTCDRCGETTYCVHVDDGVTPMFLACRAHGEAGSCGMGTSLMYPAPPVPDHVIAAVRWEWYSPDPKEKTTLYFEDPPVFDHVDKGGLLLRELTDAGRAELHLPAVEKSAREGDQGER